MEWVFSFFVSGVCFFSFVSLRFWRGFCVGRVGFFRLGLRGVVRGFLFWYRMEEVMFFLYFCVLGFVEFLVVYVRGFFGFF